MTKTTNSSRKTNHSMRDYGYRGSIWNGRNSGWKWAFCLLLGCLFALAVEQTIWASKFNNEYQMYYTTTTWDSISPTLDVQENHLKIDGVWRGLWRFSANSGQYLMLNTTRVPNPYIRDSSLGNHGYYWIFVNAAPATYGNIVDGKGLICNYNMTIENGDCACLSIRQGAMEWNCRNTIRA